MVKTSWVFASAAIISLSACAGSGIGDTDTERAVIGAAAGLATAEVLNTDPTATAVAGVAAGLLCDDAGICRPAR